MYKGNTSPLAHGRRPHRLPNKAGHAQLQRVLQWNPEDAQEIPKSRSSTLLCRDGRIARRSVRSPPGKSSQTASTVMHHLLYEIIPLLKGLWIEGHLPANAEASE
jgi:hypothetical protein